MLGVGGMVITLQDVQQQQQLWPREIMMGVGNRVASVIMLTFPSEPCPHADFSK